MTSEVRLDEGIKFDFEGDSSMVLTAVGGILAAVAITAVYQIHKESQDRRSEHEYVPYGFCAAGILRRARDRAN